MSRVIHRLAVVPLTLFGLSLGCSQRTFEIRMEPQGDDMERRLTTGLDSKVRSLEDDDREYASMSSQFLDHLRAEYKTEPTRSASGRYDISAKFNERMPQDVGGFGTYKRWTSHMGALGVYLERFRGDKDLADDLQSRMQVVDRVTHHVSAWLETELGGHPQWAEFREFVQDSFRQDLRNVIALVWSSSTTADLLDQDQDKKLGEAVVVRLIHYALEHRYLTAEAFPRALRMFQGQDFSEELLLSLLRDFLSSRFDIDSADMRFLASSEAAAASLKQYLKGTAEYQAQLRERREQDPSAEPPDPLHIVGELVFELVGFELSGTDAVYVKLGLPVEPFATNGKWDATKSRLIWDHQVAKTETQRYDPAPFSYAAWSEANEDFQRKRFGRVILRGQDLGGYILWRAALTEPEAAEWDTFVASLSADQDVRQLVKRFRFTGDPKPDATDPSPSSLADVPRKLIRDNLDKLD